MVDLRASVAAQHVTVLSADFADVLVFGVFFVHFVHIDFSLGLLH